MSSKPIQLTNQKLIATINQAAAIINSAPKGSYTIVDISFLKRYNEAVIHQEKIAKRKKKIAKLIKND